MCSCLVVSSQWHQFGQFQFGQFGSVQLVQSVGSMCTCVVQCVWCVVLAVWCCCDRFVWLGLVSMAVVAFVWCHTCCCVAVWCCVQHPAWLWWHVCYFAFPLFLTMCSFATRTTNNNKLKVLVRGWWKRRWMAHGKNSPMVTNTEAALTACCLPFHHVKKRR